MPPRSPDHYAALGLDRHCSADQIRTAYRYLAKQHHPDRNRDSAEAVERTQELNAAYETLSHPALRRAYDETCEGIARVASPRAQPPLQKSLPLFIEDFFRGITLQVKVDDPANPEGGEIYELLVPPETVPGTIFRIQRDEAFGGGLLRVKVKARSSARFQVRGFDLRTDLRISAARAKTGGRESIRGADGRGQMIEIPLAARRGSVIRLPGAGLPSKRGGRGDLLVRVVYRPEVRFIRRS